MHKINYVNSYREPDKLVNSNKENNILYPFTTRTRFSANHGDTYLA
jgi:hypothetical protein